MRKLYEVINIVLEESIRKMLWKSIHGINLWKINRYLNKMAHSKSFMEGNINEGKLIVKLSPIEGTDYSSYTAKKEIEEAITNLEGFESLKISLFKKCNIFYKENIVNNTLSRWIEIKIEGSIPSIKLL